MLAWILAAALDVQSAVVVKSLQPLHELPIAGSFTDIPQVAYARDAQFEYLGTPVGLYRAPRIARAPLERIAFAGESVNALAVDGDALYVSRGLPFYAVWPQPTLLRSRDHGATFEQSGAGLHDCIVESECGYLVPREISFAPGRIFTSAGGNVLVSADDGANFTVLVGATPDGKPAAQVCPVTYERIGERLLFGGECPLDAGYVARGELRPDLLGWSVEWKRLAPPELPQIQNRNVQVIRDIGGGVAYAGIEGALLKSTDRGATWRFVIHYPLSEGERYPYITTMLVTPRVFLAGGFDKAHQVAYLAYSIDGGETWSDISSMVADASMVSLVAEDADGRLLVVTAKNERLVISELVAESVRKQRSVRR